MAIPHRPETSASLAGLRSSPRTSAVLLDFDGTLARIVPNPDDARLLDGLDEVLRDLHDRYARLAVVSGRPLDFLVRHLPPDLDCSGLYGIEERISGVRREHPGAGRWRDVITRVVTTATASAPVGTRVEAKGLSLTLHYREHPEIREDLEGWAESQAEGSGLVARQARFSVELHPPIAADKGTAVEELAAGCDHVCYVGDDLGDLPAFRALDRLAGRGVATVKVAVDGPEAPVEVLASADVAVDGPDGTLAFLRSLT